MEKNYFIPVAKPDLGGNERKYLNKCISSSWISSKGEFIDKFEAGFAKFIKTRYAVSTSNGTTALHLALVALGIGEKDEVIVPDLTFIASANAVSYTGAKAVLVDVERKTWNIDPKKIQQKISSKTKAIMIVHLYGHPANMDQIIPIAKKNNLIIIEDAAEAHGAEVKMKQWSKVGSIGEVGCFSFYGNKIITTGEGGMVVTNNRELADKMRMLRDHGQKPDRRYYHEVIGFNYRMTNLQAAIGLAQLERIDKFIKLKRLIAQFYNKHLKNIPGIILPPQEGWARSVFWMYSILIDKPYPYTRDQLIYILQKKNIESRPFFYPLHSLPPYKIKDDFKNSDYLSQHGLNLPSSVTLTKKDIQRIAYIIQSLKK
jgi:perosamine synthetase